MTEGRGIDTVQSVETSALQSRKSPCLRASVVRLEVALRLNVVVSLKELVKLRLFRRGTNLINLPVKP